MERRELLGFICPLVALSGCVSDPAESGPGSESRTTTDDCGWPQFCEGSTIVEVFVSSRFSGAVVLEAGCRDQDVEVRPGETKTVTRQVDAEACDIALYVDDREAYADTIRDYESTTLEVNSNGEVFDETVEL